MKIRHKQSGVVIEGKFTECVNEGWGKPTVRYFMSIDTFSQYDKVEWEEVKPVWKDVTAECEVLEGARIYLGESSIAEAVAGFRLRKIRYYEGVHRGTAYEYRDAFIIEQRQA